MRKLSQFDEIDLALHDSCSFGTLISATMTPQKGLSRQFLGTRLDVKCSVSAMTRCGGSLIPPRFLSISVSDAVERNALESIVESEFLAANYVEESLAFRPWLMEL